MPAKDLRSATIRRQCPVETSLSIIGGKWKGMILYHLLSGTKRFSELEKAMPAVTHRTLTLQLRELENDGIVSRKIYAEVPPRVEYSLTEFGRSVRPVIESLRQWGQAYQNLKETPPGSRQEKEN